MNINIAYLYLCIYVFINRSENCFDLHQLFEDIISYTALIRTNLFPPVIISLCTHLDDGKLLNYFVKLQGSTDLDAILPHYDYNFHHSLFNHRLSKEVSKQFAPNIQ